MSFGELRVNPLHLSRYSHLPRKGPNSWFQGTWFSQVQPSVHSQVALPRGQQSTPCQVLTLTNMSQSVGQLHAGMLMSALGLNPGSTVSTGQLWSQFPHP